MRKSLLLAVIFSVVIFSGAAFADVIPIEPIPIITLPKPGAYFDLSLSNEIQNALVLKISPDISGDYSCSFARVNDGVEEVKNSFEKFCSNKEQPEEIFYYDVPQFGEIFYYRLNASFTPNENGSPKNNEQENNEQDNNEPENNEQEKNNNDGSSSSCSIFNGIFKLDVSVGNSVAFTVVNFSKNITVQNVGGTPYVSIEGN